MRLSLLFAVALLVGGCIRSVADLPTEEGGFITGTVVARDVDTALFEPVVGARVDLVGGSVGRTSDDEGRFRLRRLPLGPHALDLLLRASGGSTALARRVAGLRLEADGQSLDLGDIQLGGLADVEGSARLADVDSEAAAAGSVVVLVATAFQSVVGLDGRYRLPRVPAGQYQVAVLRPAYAPARIDGVEIGAGLTVELARVELVPMQPGAAYEVRGRVEVTEGDADAIEVQFISETTDAVPAESNATTDADGAFRLPLPTGVYRVRFDKPGYRPAQLRNVVVTPTSVLGLDRVVLGPLDPADQDGDGIPDDQDDDDDGDGCADSVDQDPNDAFVCTGDDYVADHDGDGLLDIEEIVEGADGWVTDPDDADTDDDLVNDDTDPCPLLPNVTICPRGTMPMTGTPTVASFQPATQGAGLPLTLIGENLGSAIGVEFFGGTFAPARNVTDAAFVVDVPALAQDGALRAYFAGSIVLDVPGTFTSLPGPVVIGLAESRVSLGGLVTLEGTNLDQITDVWIGGVAAVEDSRSSESLTVRVPAAVTPGVVVVEYAWPTGRRAAPGSLRVLADPFIGEILPPAVPAGATIAIHGTGFLPEQAADPITVTFDGTPGTIVGEPSDRVIEVTLPATLPEGIVDVVVTRSGQSSLAAPMTIDGAAVAILRVDPPILYEGDTLRIHGRNLHAPPTFSLNAVRFGNVSATVTSMGPNLVEVTVPVDAPTSAVTLDVTNNGAAGTASYPYGPVILRVASELAVSNQTACGSLSNDQLAIWTGTNLRIHEYDLTQPITDTITPPQVITCRSLAIAPNRQVAIIEPTMADRLVVMSWPEGVQIGPTCVAGDVIGPGTQIRIYGSSVGFDSTSRYAYVGHSGVLTANGESGLLRVDLTTGACEPYGPTFPMWRVYSAHMIPGSNNGRLALQVARQQSVDTVILDLTVDPPIALAGPGPGVPGAFQSFALDVAPGAFWHGATLADPQAAQATTVLPRPVNAFFVVQSQDLRFVWGYTTMDLGTRRVAGMPTASEPAAFALTSPAGRAAWFHNLTNPARVRVTEVLRAPPPIYP